MLCFSGFELYPRWVPLQYFKSLLVDLVVEAKILPKKLLYVSEYRKLLKE